MKTTICETLEKKTEISCYNVNNLEMFKPLYHELNENKDQLFIQGNYRSNLTIQKSILKKNLFNKYKKIFYNFLDKI